MTGGGTVINAMNCHCFLIDWLKMGAIHDSKDAQVKACHSMADFGTLGVRTFACLFKTFMSHSKSAFPNNADIKTHKNTIVVISIFDIKPLPGNPD